MNSNFFLPYQEAWIKDDSRIKLMEKSRQIGMSWSTAYELVRRHCLPTCKYDSWVSSRDELQAKLFINDCKKFADILNIAFADIGVSRFLDGSDSHSIEFNSGTKIWSLSSNPDAQAGKRGTRVLDEFALHPDPEKLYAIAYPGITWGGSMQIISTHRGKDNFFHKLVEEARFNGNPKKISLHRVTLEDALNQGFLQKLKENLPAEHEISSMSEADYFDHIKNSCADNESFLQEYMCQPSDDNSTFISYEDICRCLYKPDQNWQNIESKESFLYLGVDVGRTTDLSVFWLVEKIGDIVYTRDVSVFQDTPFSEQEAHLYGYLKNHRLRKVAIDQSGLGRQFCERAIERYGARRIEGVSFTQQTKETMAYLLRSQFQDCKLRIPDDIKIRADIRAVKKEISQTGSVRFSAQRTIDGHADRFWALALATYASKGSNCNNNLEIVQKKPINYIW